jgi:hypothetical protein
MITELCNRNCARTCWSGIGVDFREQPDYGAPHSSLIRVVFDGTNNLLVVKTFAARIDLGPAKLPDLGTSFAIESLNTPMLHLSPPAPPLQSRRIFRYGGEQQLEGCETSAVNCFAAAMLVLGRKLFLDENFRFAVLNRPMSLNRLSEVRSGVFLDSE